MSEQIELVYRQFGIKIEAMRQNIGINQKELADRVGMSRGSIANIETGRQRVLLADVEVFAKAFGTNPKHLLKGIWI